MNVTLYLQAEDKPVIDRARKLLAFHHDQSLGDFFIEQLRLVVAKYDKSSVQEGS